jgi:pimeloyl-ACP methyl ester carboxylesterase
MQPSTITVADAPLADGARTTFATAGSPTGTPVVLLHGLSDSWRSYTTVLERLPAGMRAYAVSLRGHGDGDHPETGYQVSELAEDVAAFLDHVGVGRAVIVGHSLGAAVASAFAVAHPERAQALVLVAGFGRPGDDPALAEFGEVIASLTDPVDADFVAEFQASTTAVPVPPAFMEMVVAESAKLPAHVWKGAIDGFMRHDHLAGLDRLAVPTLVLWGDQDQYVPRAEQDLFVQLIPGARLDVFEGIGHAVHWEAPERFIDTLASFVAATAG